MFKPSMLVTVLFSALLLFGCAHPKAITEKNRKAPLQGRGVMLTPPADGSLWRYGTFDRQGLVGFYKFITDNDGSAVMTVVQSWVVKENNTFNTAEKLSKALFNFYKYNMSGVLKLDVSSHELTEVSVNGMKVPMLQMWGRHQGLSGESKQEP